MSYRKRKQLRVDDRKRDVPLEREGCSRDSYLLVIEWVVDLCFPAKTQRMFAWRSHWFPRGRPVTFLSWCTSTLPFKRTASSNAVAYLSAGDESRDVAVTHLFYFGDEFGVNMIRDRNKASAASSNGARVHRPCSPTALSRAEKGYSAKSNKGKRRRHDPLATSTLMGFVGPLERARIRRFLFQLRKNPRKRRLVIAGVVMAVLVLLIWLFLVTRYYVFSSASLKAAPDILLSRKTTESTKSIKIPGDHSAHVVYPHDTSHKKKIFGSKKDDGPKQRKSSAASNVAQMEILLESVKNLHRSDGQDGIKLPSQDFWGEDDYADFGGLQIRFFGEVGGKRHIMRDEEDFYDPPPLHVPDPPFDDDMDTYYYFDDDIQRAVDVNYEEDGSRNETKICRRISEHRYNFQNCNDFHHIDPLDPASQIQYLASGGYRDVFSVVNPLPGDQLEKVAIKDTTYHHAMGYEDIEFVRMDAIVAERLTASPRIYDIYGYCGFGVLSEFFHHGDIEKDVSGGDDGYMDLADLEDKDGVKPQNDLTGIQKLVLALEMAESVADLHGYPGGVIIHDDIQLSQWLFNEDKTRLKLNDFNRAEFPQFDEEQMEYCR